MVRTYWCRRISLNAPDKHGGTERLAVRDHQDAKNETEYPAAFPYL
jgi:hypothetical protein